MLIDRRFLFAGAAAAGAYALVPPEHHAQALQVSAAAVCVLLAVFCREVAIKVKLTCLQLSYLASVTAPSLLDWAVAQYEVGELLKLEEVRAASATFTGTRFHAASCAASPRNRKL
jgi:hypothetical protein